MALDTKQGITDEITARKDAMPSGVTLPDGSSPAAPLAPKLIFDEALAVTDAILALASGSGPQNTTRDSIRATIAALQIRKGSSAFVDGVQQKGPVPPKLMPQVLAPIVFEAVTLLNAIYTATDALTLATTLKADYVDGVAGRDASAPSASSVYVNGSELAGHSSLRAFRAAALNVLGAAVAHLP